MVRSWGLRVRTVADVAAAIDELRRAAHHGDPVRLVLSDVQMPNADGFDLAAALKRNPTLGKPVTILLTSGGYAGDDACMEEAGVAASLVKPVRHSELLETIQSVMGLTLAPERDSIVPESTVRLEPMRVLVAEDSLANQRLAVGMLEKDGHTVTVTSTGAEAVDVFTAGTFDVILMDLQMPEYGWLRGAPCDPALGARDGNIAHPYCCPHSPRLTEGRRALPGGGFRRLSHQAFPFTTVGRGDRRERTVDAHEPRRARRSRSRRRRAGLGTGARDG